MKNSIQFGLALVALSVVLTACEPDVSDESRSYAEPPQPMGKAMMMAADSPAQMMRAEVAMTERMEVGRNYQIEVLEDTLKAQLERDRTQCLQLNCTITAQSQSGDPAYPTAYLRAMVPGESANKFHAFVSNGEGRYIQHFQETANNRTQAYQDTEARIRRLNFMRERLYKLAEQKSDRVGDLVQVERELMRVEGDIERLTHQKQNIEKVTDNVAFTLSYSVRPPKAGDINFGPFSGLLSDSLNAFIRGVRATTIWVARWLPAVLLLGLGVWLWRRRRSRDA